jgi:hypothetical protein
MDVCVRLFCVCAVVCAGSGLELQYPLIRLQTRNEPTIAQAVSLRLPTAAAPVRTHVRSCGICGGLSGTGADFLRVLRFPLTILIPPLDPDSSSSIIWGWYNGPVVADVPSGRSLTPPPRN